MTAMMMIKQKDSVSVYFADEIELEDLSSVVPKRQCISLTINCLSNAAAKKDDEKWFSALMSPNNGQKKKLLAIVVA